MLEKINPANPDLTLRLPPELLGIGARIEAWLHYAAEVVWWDGFTRGALAAAIIVTVLFLAFQLFRRK